jgi:DNA polymerase I
MAERWVLIDGSSLIYRAFFALPATFSTASGLHTNATYGFALMFRKILAGRMPNRGAVVFDAPGPTFRDAQFPDYKAQRPRMPAELREQLPWITKVVEAHDFPTLSIEGFEADDVIGTLTRRALALGHDVHIIAPDKDFAQLIGPRVRMIDTMRDITYDEELVRKKWGVPPSQFVDLLALTGDKVDNIPGVPGIGGKGAADLLAKYGSLDGVLANLGELKGKTKTTLETNRDSAILSRALATIDQHVPLTIEDEALRIKPIDTARVNTLYRELEFFSFLDTEAPAKGEHGEALVAEHTTLGSADDLEAFLRGDTPLGVFAIFEAPSPMEGEWVGTALARPGEKAVYVPAAVGKEVLAAWLASTAPKVFHDVRDAYTLFGRYDIALGGVAGDTALGSFLVDPAGLIPHRLDQVVKQYLHRTVLPAKSVTGSGQKELTWKEAPQEAVGAWAGTIAMAIAEAWPLVERRVDEEGQRAQLFERDIPLARVLAEMQRAGILVDREDLGRMGIELTARKAEVEAKIYVLAGRTFNIGSTKQLGDVLFEELKLPVLKRTKTGYSTDQEVLERLAHKHEIAREILRFRSLAKLINTYIEVLTQAVSPTTGRIHCTFLQTTGVSGRLITTDPDLQRTPIRTEDGKRIRAAFIAQPSHQIISADWSQIELRLLAHVTSDPELRAAFEEGVDVHRRTAAAIYDVAPEDVTPEQRVVGKTVNFATIYGQGATALGQSLDMPRAEAKRVIDRYFERYAGVRTWIDATVKQAKEVGYVETLFGRRRYVAELSSGDPTTRSYGERIAANTPIQGSAADLCKLAMLQIAKGLEGKQTRMLLQIHDELVFEAPEDEVSSVVALVRDRMENCYPLSVPLVVDVGHGKSWAAAKG